MLGVIHLNSKLIYGINNKKNPYYKVEPFRDYESKNYLVAINDKKLINNNKKYYILFKPNEGDDSRMPKASLIKIIGELGKKDIEKEKFLYHYKINQSQKKYKLQFKTIYDLIEDNELEHYQNLTELYTCAIDPPGCKDIDDALSYQRVNETHCVYVHIADVSFWLNKYNLMEYVNKQKFTFYSYNKNYNVFPQIFSENLFSLTYNKDRLAFTLKLTFDNNFNLLDSQFMNSIIKVNKTMSYQKAENILKQNQDLKMLFEIGKTLFPQPEYDIHTMIENYMVKTNSLAAEFLVKHNKDVILRKHHIKHTRSPQVDSKIEKFVKYYQYESAIYEKYTTGENYHHNGLNLKYYCHFTSPIRRVVDIDTHLKMKEVLHNIDNKMVLDCESINQEHKTHKKVYRDFDKINKLYDSQLNKLYDAYLIDYQENKLIFYIPELDLCDKIKIINNKLLHLYDFELTGEEMTMTNKETNEIIHYNRYQNLKIKILKTETDFIFYNEN